MPYDTNHFHHLRFWVQHVLPLVYDDSLSYYEFLAKVCHYLNHTIDDVKQLAEAYNQFEVDVNATLQKYQDEYNKLKEEINQQFTDLEAEFNGKFDELKEDYNTKFEQLRREFEQKFTELTTQLSDTITQLFNEYSSTLNAQFENYKNKTDKAIADFEENINNQFKDYTTKTDKAIEDFEDNINTQFNEHKQDINQQFEQFKTALQEDVEEYKSELDTKFNDYKTSLDTTINNFKTSVTEEIAQHKADVTKEINQHKADVTQQISEFENTVNTTVEQYKTDIENSFNTFKTELTQRFEEYKDSIDTQISAITTDIEQFEQEITQKLTDLTKNAIKSVSGQKQLTIETTFEEIEENVLYVSVDTAPKFILDALRAALNDVVINFIRGSESYFIKPKNKPNTLIVFNGNLLATPNIQTLSRSSRAYKLPLSPIFTYDNDTKKIRGIYPFFNPNVAPMSNTFREYSDLSYPKPVLYTTQPTDIPLNTLAYCTGINVNNLNSSNEGLLLSAGSGVGSHMSLFYGTTDISYLNTSYTIPDVTLSNDLFNTLYNTTDLINAIANSTLKLQQIQPLTENVKTACPSQNVLYLFQGLSEISVEDAGLPSGSVFPQGGEMLGYIRFSATGTQSDFVKEVAYLISFATGKAWVALYPTGGSIRWTEMGTSGVSSGDVEQEIQNKLDDTFVYVSVNSSSFSLKERLAETLAEKPNAKTIEYSCYQSGTTSPKLYLNELTTEQFSIRGAQRAEPQYLIYFKGDVSPAIDYNEHRIIGKLYSSSNINLHETSSIYVTDIYYDQNAGEVLYIVNTTPFHT